MKLAKDTVLQRARTLEVKLCDDVLIVASSRGEFRGGAHTLSILDLFSTPKSLDEGVRILSSRAHGLVEWAGIASQVVHLCEIGALVSPSGQGISLPSHNGRFSSPDVHIRMLDDQMRTSAFQRAMFAQIGPDDVVVDIGTGTGILAATAVLAGARRVYAVERSTNLAALARGFFERNGLAGRVTVIEGDSTQLELPEKGDVLVSEIIGNDPLEEGIISTLSDACKRLLKPDARLIPNRLRVYALLLTMPERQRRRVLFTPEAAADWKRRYGLDFSSYVEFCSGESFHLNVQTHRVKAWPRLSDPILVADLDWCSPESVLTESRHEVSVTQDGLLNAILVFFEADLGANVCLSLHPAQASVENSWASYVWVPGKPIRVRAGSRLGMTYRWTGKKSEFSFG